MSLAFLLSTRGAGVGGARLPLPGFPPAFLSILALNNGRTQDSIRAALTVRTKDAAPADWALTQNNLASALADLAELSGQDRCGLLRRSIACGKGALTVWTPEAAPHKHAITIENMAIDRLRYEELGCHIRTSGIAFDDIPPAR